MSENTSGFRVLGYAFRDRVKPSLSTAEFAQSPGGKAELSPGPSPGWRFGDHKSRRDDWNLPGGELRAAPSQHIRDLRILDSLPEFRTMSQLTFSVVPAGLFNGACKPRTASRAKFSRPYGTQLHDGRSHADSLAPEVRLSCRSRIFPQPVKPNREQAIYGTAEAVPWSF